jgi:hypothetical protein
MAGLWAVNHAERRRGGFSGVAGASAADPCAGLERDPWWDRRQALVGLSLTKRTT